MIKCILCTLIVVLSNVIQANDNTNFKLISTQRIQVSTGRGTIVTHIVTIVKIDNCKYIFTTNLKNDVVNVIHANDCEFCLKNKK